MRVLLSSLLLPLFCFSLEITVNIAKDSNREFEIIHIKNDTPFQCKKVVKNINSSFIECNLDKNLTYNSSKILKFATFKIDKNKIFIIPKAKVKLIPIFIKLYEEKTIPPKKAKKANHWQIVAFKELPYFQKEKKEGINFPITYDNFLTPFVGALDINKEPISYDEKIDIKPYNKLQKLYKERDYEEVIKEADYIMRKYPNTLFMSEIMLYKMRAMDKFLSLKSGKDFKIKVSYSDLASLAKKWIKRFPSNPNLTEVLMLLSKAYLHSGLKKNALYYLNVLTSEYKHSKFTELAKIYLADIYAESKPKKALRMYKDIYYSTKNIEVASTAADRIAWLLFKLAKYKKAKEYFLKILKANPNFYLEDKIRAYNIAQKLAANNLPEVAAAIADKLIEQIPKKHKKRFNFYEELVKNRAFWYDKAKDTKKAYKYYKEYEEMFPLGEFVDFVKERLDLLVLVKPDQNATKTLKKYDYIIENYQDEDVVKKAYFEKAKLLLKLKRYAHILDMEKELKSVTNKKKEVEKIIKETALNYAIENLLQNRCEKTNALIEKYSLKIPSKYDRELFECYLNLSLYQKAYKIFRKHQFEKSLQNKLQWLYRGLALYKAQNKNEKILEILSDIKSLSSLLKKPVKKEAKYLEFYTLKNLNRYPDMIKKANELEKEYKDDFKNIDIFYQVVKAALNRLDELSVLNFAKKIVNLQNIKKLYPYSPEIEFIYIEALKRAEKNKEALNIAKNLIKRVKNLNDKSRALYLAGELSLKLKKTNQAKNFFKECKDLNTTSSWRELCIDNLSLIN